MSEGNTDADGDPEDATGGDPPESNEGPTEPTGDSDPSTRSGSDAEVEGGVATPNPTQAPVTGVRDVIEEGSREDAQTRTEEATVDGETVEVTVAERPADDSTGADERARGGQTTVGRHDERGDRERRRDRASRSGAKSEAEAELEREILDPEERIGPEEQYCYDCGAIISIREDTCPDCGNPFPDQADPKATTRKVPELSAALSLLLPGLGHLYNEQFGRALLAFFGSIALVAAIGLVGLLVNVLVTVVSLFSLSPIGTAIMILALAFGWLLPVSISAWDAYGQAREINNG